MSLGLRMLLSFLITIITIIGERGIPIKYQKWDTLIYTSEFVLLMFISDMK